MRSLALMGLALFVMGSCASRPPTAKLRGDGDEWGDSSGDSNGYTDAVGGGPDWSGSGTGGNWSGLDPSLFLPSGTVSADPPPPPIQGGTLLVTKDGHTAIAADPDRDRVYVVDLDQAKPTFTVALQPGDQPGRAAEDAQGFVHVALRRGGAIVRIDPKTGAVDRRRAVCPAPSGIAYDAASDLLFVACETGELVSLAPQADARTVTLELGRDLRDVGVRDGTVWVSRLRSAEVLRVRAGALVGSTKPAGVTLPTCVDEQVVDDLHTPTAGWRLRLDGARPMMLHQLSGTQPLGVELGAYAHHGNCARIVEPALTAFADDGAATTAALGSQLTLATDFAVTADGKRVAIAVPGGSWGPALPNAAVLEPTPKGWIIADWAQAPGEITAVAFDGKGRVVMQSREPAFVAVAAGTLSTAAVIALGGPSRFDTGLALFHLNTGIGLACASCHPAGRDDGHVWRFADRGPRRTQSLAQHLAATAPYHWDGQLADIPALVHEVFNKRMLGAELWPAQIATLQHWLASLPPPAPKVALDPAAAAAGQALFVGAASCVNCHSGPELTNNATVDVGTGFPAQVPSLLGVGMRAPFLHTGCAATLADRFDPACGGANHGDVAGLTPAQIDALVAYLATL